MDSEKNGVGHGLAWNEARLANTLREGGYDDAVSDYETYVEGDLERQQEIKNLIAALPETITSASGQEVDLKETTALSLGVGPGVGIEELLERVKKVIAVDKSNGMVERTAEKFPDQQRVEAVQDDMLKMEKISDESVETVIALGVVFEIPPSEGGRIDSQFLSEIMRVLKSGGVCIIDGVSNSKKFSKDEFAKEREADLVRAKDMAEESAVTQRFHVFLDSELKDSLKDLDFDCEVESIYGKNENAEHCGVKITKK